eukprot:UN25510
MLFIFLFFLRNCLGLDSCCDIEKVSRMCERSVTTFELSSDCDSVGACGQLVFEDNNCSKYFSYSSLTRRCVCSSTMCNTKTTDKTSNVYSLRERTSTTSIDYPGDYEDCDSCTDHLFRWELDTHTCMGEKICMNNVNNKCSVLCSIDNEGIIPPDDNGMVESCYEQ